MIREWLIGMAAGAGIIALVPAICLAIVWLDGLVT